MDDATEPPAQAVAAFRCVTGTAAGRTLWFAGETADVGPGEAGPRLSPPEDPSEAPPIDAWARLARRGDGFSIEAVGTRPLWLNGRRIDRAQLVDDDTVEFGEDGPIARFALHGGGRAEAATVSDLFRDAEAYVRVSRRPMSQRAGRAAGGLLRRLATETTLQFRAGVVLAVIALVAGLWWQGRQIAALQAARDVETARVEAVAASLAEARREALRTTDLDVLRAELEDRLTATRRAVDDRFDAVAEVAGEVGGSVAFLQGAFGFRDAATGRMLRHVLDADGRPASTPFGRPLLSLEGDGEPAARVWTGTGFLAGDPARIVTNHHVAIPWKSDPASLAVAPQGLEPVLLRFEAFLPGLDQPMAMKTVALDETADLALLAPSDDLAFDRPALPLGRDSPRVGQAAVAIGFPTGLRAMLARAGPEMLAEIRETGADDDRSVAMELAARDLIEPLVTVGVVAQSSAGAVVFDAATTRGGSGGPLLSLTGDVIGVQSAILSDFSGSNLAVPAARLRALLASAE